MLRGMQVAFEETMAGTYEGRDGERGPMIFNVRAIAPRARAFFTGEPMRLEGDITVGDLVRGVPVAGSLEVNPIRGKELVYRLTFATADGSELSYMGRKLIKLRHLVRSMTTLDGRLYEGSTPIGAATLTFDLRHLPQFLRSFRVGR